MPEFLQSAIPFRHRRPASSSGTISQVQLVHVLATTDAVGIFNQGHRQRSDHNFCSRVSLGGLVVGPVRHVEVVGSGELGEGISCRESEQAGGDKDRVETHVGCLQDLHLEGMSDFKPE